MSMNRIEAPFTPDQVERLNLFQEKANGFHPFTCGSAKRCVEQIKIGDGEKSFEVSTTLVATERGWICPNCDYTQNWAWDTMLAIGEIIKDTGTYSSAEVIRLKKEAK